MKQEKAIDWGSFMDVVSEVTELTKGFEKNSDSFPCAQCGRPLSKNSVKHWDFVLCSATCKRRFVARMKADGVCPTKTMQRFFREVFRLARGTVEGQLQSLPLLPTREAWLLYVTGNLHRMEDYRGGNPFFENCW